MTAIIAWWALTKVAIVADCRVSYPPEYAKADDCLQKLYEIDDRFVIGFAGPLQGAYEVLELVRENYLRGCCDPPIADNLLRDVERWIQFKYRQLAKGERTGLSFILAAVEPHREKRAKWSLRDADGNVRPSSKPSWFPFIPDWKVLALRPSRCKPTELVRDEKEFVHIIGSARDYRQTIEDGIMGMYGFAFRQPRLQMRVMMNMLTARLMEKRAKTVGGLFQCALLSRNGVEWIGYGGRNVVLQFAEDGIVQRNTNTGETLPLMNIWEWKRKWEEGQLEPGRFGTFEDSQLREAIEKQQSLEEDSSVQDRDDGDSLE